jgi:pimeloyl-ACP methyl ester carboxylesterase
MAYEMSLYKVGDQELFVREEGRQGRQVVLLIHGWSSSWYALSPLLPMLGKRRHCLAVDLPGYGQSPPGPEAASIAGYADLLAGLIQEVTDRPVLLVGHSMGGMIGLTLTLRHPDLVERVVLLCPTISGRLTLFINLFISPVTFLERYQLAGWLVSRMEARMLGVTDRLMRPASFSVRSGVSPEDYNRLRADARRSGQGRVRAECFWAMRAGDLRGKLGKIKAPGLVIWGMEDNTVPLRDASVLVDEWPAADLRIIPGASHWPQFEKADLTRRYITAFLSTPLKLFQVEF